MSMATSLALSMRWKSSRLPPSSTTATATSQLFFAASASAAAAMRFAASSVSTRLVGSCWAARPVVTDISTAPARRNRSEGCVMRANGNTIGAMTANQRKVRWGVLGVANIATEKVIPAMQHGDWSEVVAIASRDAGRASTAARELGLARSHGSYEALIDDAEIEAIYNPLPNHLHVPWTIRALEAGKHVLCEKPIGLTVADAEQLIEVRNRTGRKVQEALMVRTHPQWLTAQALVREGRIGELRSIAGYFSYFNRDAGNIRNVPTYGGGAMMDIGCYLIHTSRMMFGAEPRRVVSLIERDPEMHVDRLSSLMLDFERGQAIGTCST